MKKKTLPKSYKCACGKVHVHPAYLYAHWDEIITHTCDCGRKNDLLRGKKLP
ncbi:Uncharacterised protein [uncultured archaeon]|nr:Uncharacterised protein [uncultured archaeon]